MGCKLPSTSGIQTKPQQPVCQMEHAGGAGEAEWLHRGPGSRYPPCLQCDSCIRAHTVPRSGSICVWHRGNTQTQVAGGEEQPMGAILSTVHGAGPSPVPATQRLLCPSAEEGESSVSTAPNCISSPQQYIFPSHYCRSSGTFLLYQNCLSLLLEEGCSETLFALL